MHELDMFRIFERLKGYRWLVSLGLVALFVVLPTVVFAQTASRPPSGSGVIGSFTNDAITWIAGALSWFLGIVVNFLGRIILLLVNILLGFLSYNDFAHAAPVEIGWKILRDLSNMFFIVILMICAFSTIIGYNHDFHVRKVLPKLLFTAVTINFSKTLVGLMIDASQVVMLAFVNAFQAVGVGNFVNALHLQNVSAIAPATANDAVNIVIEVILSYMLAIAMLILSIGVILIMIIFVVGRIVGLWMSLIFAPLAFLVGALPGKMSEKVGKISKDYWPRLNGLLFGGPTIAFFLWLTFATVNSMEGDQSLNIFQIITTGADGGPSAANSIFTVTQDMTSQFLTRIGSVHNLASYLIAITMLMLGLDAAMDAVSSAGGFGKDLAASINKKAREYASTAAASPFTLPLAAARGTANYIDRRADISGRAAALARAVPLVDAIAGDKLRKIQFARRKEWEEQKQFRMDDVKKSTRGFEKWIARGKAERAAMLSPVFGHQGDTLGYAAILESEGSQEKFVKRSKELAKPIEDKLLADKTVHPPVAKSLASQQANKQATQERLKTLNEALGVLDKDRDKETYEKIEDQIKQIKKENPAFLEGEDRDKAMAGVSANLANLSDEQTSNLEVLMNSTNEELRGQAFNFDKATGNYTIKDPLALSQMVAAHKGKPTEKKFDALVGFMKNNPSGVTLEQMRNFSIQKGKDDSYGVYDKQTGKTVTTEKQRIAAARINELKDDPSRNRTMRNGQTALPYNAAEKDISKAPLGNAVLAAIPHVGIAEALSQVGDQDGAGTRLLEEQFKASGGAINTYDIDYDEDKDYILNYGKPGASDQAKFEAQSQFQENFQRVEAIMDDVPSTTVDPNQRVELMAAMDANRADRFVTAPSSMLEPGQKKTALKVKEMAQTTIQGLRVWRNNNKQAANDAALVDIDAPAIRKMNKIAQTALAENRDLTRKERDFCDGVMAENGAFSRLKKAGLLDGDSPILLEDKVKDLGNQAVVKEGIKYNRAYRFAMNVTRESSKKGRARRN